MSRRVAGCREWFRPLGTRVCGLAVARGGDGGGSRRTGGRARRRWHRDRLWPRDRRAFANTDFGCYRPWSRELHFWTLQHVVGPHEPGFRVASLALWLAALLLFLDLARRIAGRRVAAVAVLGVASLSLWGAPLTWISGSQDLWMLVFVLFALWLVHRAAHPWAVP